MIRITSRWNGILYGMGSFHFAVGWKRGRNDKRKSMVSVINFLRALALFTKLLPPSFLYQIKSGRGEKEEHKKAPW